MQTSTKTLIGLLLSAIAFGMVVPQAAAQIHYRAGVGLGNGQTVWSFQTGGHYRVTLMVVVWPLWYFQEGLETYDTVTLRIELISYQSEPGSWPLFVGDNCLLLAGGWANMQECTWTNVHLSQDEDGVTLDAALLLGLDVTVDSDAGIGTYSLKLDAIATATPDIIFEGHTSLPVYVHA